MSMVSSGLVIFDKGATYSFYSIMGESMKIEEKMFPRNIKGIAEWLEIYRFVIVKYSVSSKSGCMIMLRSHSYYVLELTKDLCIIFPQGIFTSEGYKGILLDHSHDENDSYADLNLKENKPG